MLRPTPLFQFLLQQLLRMGLVRLPQFLAIMVSALLAHLRQQFSSKFFVPKAPAPLNSPPIRLCCFLPTSMLYQMPEAPASRRTVFRDSPFTQQPIHPKPGRALTRCFEVLTIAAPPVAFQRLPGL